MERCRVALIAVVLAGAMCRIAQYAARTSFWGDESFIILNITDHTCRELLGPLDHGQAAPPAFLWIERAAALSLGVNEYSLRLYPLLCGLIALPLFARLSWRLGCGLPAVLGTAFFAFADKLISFSAELKQYSGDVLAAVVLLLIATCPKSSPLRKLAWAAGFTAVAVWFTHTSAIVFGSVAIVLFAQCWRRGYRQALPAMAVGLVPVISFAALYLLSIRHEHTSWMHEGWKDDFPDWSHPAHVPIWLGRHIYQVGDFAYRSWSPLILLMAELGIAGLWRARRFDLLGMLLLPAGLTLLAAFAGQFPFNGSRVTLFLLPPLFLLCAAGMQFVRDILPNSIRRAWWILPAPLAAWGLIFGAYHLVFPRLHTYIRPVVAYVRAHRQPGEAIYLADVGVGIRQDPNPHEGRRLELFCYWPRPSPPVHLAWPRSMTDIREKRFWIVFPFRAGHREDKKQIAKLLGDAKTIATEKSRFIEPRGGAAYLFEHR
ncbi:MAG TPA: hypothetical protein VFC78_03820 [Tepidisphaeraceae bacterium]|nr:hypothetical protein [Tepidisphaeraceae bacterium]